jgi:hypothetical protein
VLASAFELQNQMASLCEEKVVDTVATTSESSDNDPLLSRVLQGYCVVIGIIVQGGLVGRDESGADGSSLACFYAPSFGRGALQMMIHRRLRRDRHDLMRLDVARFVCFSFVCTLINDIEV